MQKKKPKQMETKQKQIYNLIEANLVVFITITLYDDS